jgi:hypothetical protein
VLNWLVQIFSISFVILQQTKTKTMAQDVHVSKNDETEAQRNENFSNKK